MDDGYALSDSLLGFSDDINDSLLSVRDLFSAELELKSETGSEDVDLPDTINTIAIEDAGYQAPIAVEKSANNALNKQSHRQSGRGARLSTAIEISSSPVK